MHALLLSCAMASSFFVELGERGLDLFDGELKLAPMVTVVGGAGFGMVRYLTESDVYRADPSRVYVTGLSAGAAMAVLLLAEWPDVFAGGAPMAGIPFDCARDVSGAMACMRADASRMRTPSGWGDRVRAAAPQGYSGPWPRIQIWQGESDEFVAFAMSSEIMEQWTDVHGVARTPTDSAPLEAGVAHTRTAYGDGVVETIAIPGMRHGVAVDGDRVGSAGAFAFDVGLSSTYHAAQFFGILDSQATPGEGEGEPGEGEGESEGEGDDACAEISSTPILHVYSLPPRMRMVGSWVAPQFQVIGSDELLAEDVNPYLDQVIVHSTGAGYALGACP